MVDLVCRTAAETLKVSTCSRPWLFARLGASRAKITATSIPTRKKFALSLDPALPPCSQQQATLHLADIAPCKTSKRLKDLNHVLFASELGVPLRQETSSMRAATKHSIVATTRLDLRVKQLGTDFELEIASTRLS